MNGQPVLLLAACRTSKSDRLLGVIVGLHPRAVSNQVRIAAGVALEIAGQRRFDHVGEKRMSCVHEHDAAHICGAVLRHASSCSMPAYHLFILPYASIGKRARPAFSSGAATAKSASVRSAPTK